MTTKTTKTPNLIEPKGNYIGGKFVDVRDVMGEIVVKSPADLTDHMGSYAYSYRAVDDATVAAREAFNSWRRTKPAERAELLKRYRDAIKKMEPRLSEVIAREVGKPMWEARQEVATMINKVDVTLNDGLKAVADYEIPAIMDNTFGACRFRPHGVFVVIGPFNFPGHLANGHIVPALATGNTVIFKPSEKSPGVGQLMAEAIHEAGFPPGVFNLVQGEREVGRRLVVSERVDGVLFTGSYEVGLKIKQDTLQQSWKLLALEMGGKNSALILDDADLDWALYETLTGAFITAGQRCSSTSRIMIHKSLFDSFVERFHQRAKAFTIGHPLDNPFMGPLIDANAVEKYLKFVGIASREGCDVIMRGKQLDVGSQGHYVTPSVCLVRNTSMSSVKKSVYQQTEIFGPNVAIYPFEDLGEAVELANATHYGLVFSVFSKSREKYEKLSEDLRAGLINWNRSTVGASSRLPFGGLKRSGNHFPTAVSASSYCMYPVASLEVAEPKPVSSLPPGLNWS
ncbi:MAG: aldehyde dehydrogenase family protein [Deltaproteobacteria bacterium]|nr:aldehyde dehydrogenase family protein [Deltaproteobacteria bacterium]